MTFVQVMFHCINKNLSLQQPELGRFGKQQVLVFATTRRLEVQDSRCYCYILTATLYKAPEHFCRALLGPTNNFPESLLSPVIRVMRTANILELFGGSGHPLLLSEPSHKAYLVINRVLRFWCLFFRTSGVFFGVYYL